MRMQWIAIAVLVAVVLYVIVVFNRLVRLRNQVREGWSGIDVQLRRRTDLIPNLVDTVKAYAAHERGLFEQIAKLRASSIAADNVSAQAAAERALKGALGRLQVLAEALPGTQGQSELSQAAGATRRNRRSTADGAPLLQRVGARPECGGPVVSKRPDRAAVRFRRGGVLRTR